MKITSNIYFKVFSVITIFYGVFFNYFVLLFFLAIACFLIYRSNNKYIYIIISCFFITFFLFDMIINTRNPSSDYVTKTEIEYEINEHYGYHPIKNRVFNEEIFYKNNLFKKNIYTINNFGHRKVKNSTKIIDNCIIFHGGSNIFGQSLNDNETLPFYVKSSLNNKYNVFNFGFNGYGPHQFLSKLENNYIEELSSCSNSIIIHQVGKEYIGRTSGKRSWGDKSPRYIFKDNKLIQKGFFSDFPFKIIMKLRKNFRHSQVFNIIHNVESVNEKDKQIYLSILKQIEKVSKEKLKKTRFIYIIWDDIRIENDELNDFLNQSENIKISKLNIDESFKSNKIPGDNHPTKEFNLIIAKELKKIIF